MYWLLTRFKISTLVALAIENQPGKGIDEFTARHSIRDEPRDGGDHRPEEVQLGLGVVGFLKGGKMSCLRGRNYTE